MTLPFLVILLRWGSVFADHWQRLLLEVLHKFSQKEKARILYFIKIAYYLEAVVQERMIQPLFAKSLILTVA